MNEPINKKKVIISILLSLLIILGIYLFIATFVIFIDYCKQIEYLKANVSIWAGSEKEIAQSVLDNQVKSIVNVCVRLLFFLFSTGANVFLLVVLLQNKISILLTNNIYSKEEYAERKKQRKEAKRQAKIEKLTQEIKEIQNK